MGLEGPPIYELTRGYLGALNKYVRRDQSSLLLFHKIHCVAVSIEKDKYMTPAQSSKATRSSHSAQYCRYKTYSGVLKNYFFPPNYVK